MGEGADLVIGIDSGTSVVKAVAFDLAGRQLASAAILNRFTTGADGSACQPLMQTWADCVAAFGGLDVLVNVAGFHQMRHTVATTDDDWQRDLAVNLNGPFFLCRAALPHLLGAEGGNIVNVASIAGLEGEVYSAGYCAAKHGLIGLTRSLAIEFTRERLRVNAICPGGMLTAQVTDFAAPDDADWDLIMRIASPRGFMDVVDVAKTIAFLASDDAAAVHGAVYRVDNGKGAG